MRVLLLYNISKTCITIQVIFIDVQVLHGLLRDFWLWLLLLDPGAWFLFFIFFRFAASRLLGLISWGKYRILVLFLIGCVGMSGLWQLTPRAILVGLLDVVCVLARAQRILRTMRCRRSARLFLPNKCLDNFHVAVGRKILLHELLFPRFSLDLGIMSQLDDFIYKLIFIKIFEFVAITHFLYLFLDVFFKIVCEFLEHFSTTS